MVNKSVNEAVIRIRAVINALGLDLPAKKVIVNFSPTDVIKDGNYYDLPIIIGILSELNVIKNIDLSKFLISPEGKILLVNPDFKELDDYLAKNRLKN